MEHYQAFLALADQLIQEARTEINPNSNDFQRNYFEAMIRDLVLVKRTIRLHRDIMYPPDHTATFDW